MTPQVALAQKIRLSFHGRIIDQLGIQMYQSPVAAIAELISNSWDADAETVDVTLPLERSPEAEIVIKDDGSGMTLRECEEHFLKVGYCRRGNDPKAKSAEKHRPLLGRKGIGKFAGFGIAETIVIETISRSTGEKTVFELHIDEIRGNGEFVGGGIDIPIISHDEPGTHSGEHGTTIRLKNLTLGRLNSPDAFAISMSRRFLLHHTSQGFTVKINGTPLLSDFDGPGVELVFPRNYRDDEKPVGMTECDGWAEETLTDGNIVRWRICFYETPISEEELRGITIFSHGKLSQSPFFFNLTRGVHGQHGQQYMSGQIQADYLDELTMDLTSTDRQQLPWHNPLVEPLLDWGQAKVKELLTIWQQRRVERRMDDIESRVATFAPRLAKLQEHERKTVKTALEKVAQVETINDQQFSEIGDGVLNAWEKGRLKELIGNIADIDHFSSEELLKILLEADVVTTLSNGETALTKLKIVGGLKQRIENRELENAVRDYIALNPWLIAPEWETFRIERSVNQLMKDAAIEAGLTDTEFRGRIDLALASGNQLLILEFMRPGLTMDWDHLNRFERYIGIIRANIRANTGGQFREVIGQIVADNITSDPAMIEKIDRLSLDNMKANDWRNLLSRSIHTWREFIETIVTRTSSDARLTSLVESLSDT